MKNAFYLNPEFKKDIPKNIILFDDVFTTGSTLKSGLLVFKKYKTTNCWFLTIAG
jgi:predicted amidophosphoribosyltransferase